MVKYSCDVAVADLVRRFERIIGGSGYYKAADVAALTPSAVEQAAAANASAGRALPQPHLANGYAQGMQYMEVNAPSAPEPVMAEATGSGPLDPPAMQPELQFTDAQFSGYTPAYHSASPNCFPPLCPASYLQAIAEPFVENEGHGW